MKPSLRFVLSSLAGVLIYVLGLPWIAIRLDGKLRLVWRLPFWLEAPSAVALFVGLGGAIWSLFGLYSRTSSSGRAASSVERRRNILSTPLIVSGWICGVAMAFVLRSPSLFGLVGLTAIVGFVLFNQRDQLAQPWIQRSLKTIAVVMLLVGATSGLPALSIDPPSTPVKVQPGILVQVRCKPGTAMLWRTDFDEHIKPAIDEVIARGGAFTDFQLIQSVLPAQPFDFALFYTGKSLADLDQPKAPPHYAALFRREGSLRALETLKEMSSYEEQVTVTLVYLNGGR